MPKKQQIAETLRLGAATIERHLNAAFLELDASTHSVELRKHLHAIFIRKAIEVAGTRFPENGALQKTLDRMLAAVARNASATPALLGLAS